MALWHVLRILPVKGGPPERVRGVFRLPAFLFLVVLLPCSYFFFSSRRRHTRCSRDWSSDVCSSDLLSHPRPRIPLPHHGPDPGCPLGWPRVVERLRLRSAGAPVVRRLGDLRRDARGAGGRGLAGAARDRKSGG